ncbi:L-fuculokinase [Vibrio sp. VB16]|uniref:L-fuculokinase n=1 Tax=Vibrio sp. VB16 TaxID=2785746 RepID=UPI00189E681A|nr:L-fuculokinase [Vibrio sp. VB16]UGA56570.1 L-fuculokinase [Vibrio sp. VB16]
MSIVVILDCGATNVRAIAVNNQGDIVASHHLRNETVQSTDQPVKHVWDFNRIWNKLAECCQKITTQIDSNDICAVSVTTFGVDGAPFDADGHQLYPIISWKCSRTLPVMATVEQDIDRTELYKENGIGDYSFNTLYKLKWLKDHEPDVYKKMDKFVFISSMIAHRLTGNLTTDRTMAGTSMLTDLKSGHWRSRTLDYLGLSSKHFPPLINAGEKIGELTGEIAQQLGLPNNIPVISAGHDTQFALFGSGVAENQPFLSSGTWEILMARTQCPALKSEYLLDGLTTELDAKTDLYNPAIQWLSSAVMEWISGTLFNDISDQSTKYAVMISEGNATPVGSNGIHFNPYFLPNKEGCGNGSVEGLSINTTRGEIYRAALEALAYQLRRSLIRLSEVSDFNAENLVVVGGGSKNALWNQIRADVLNMPILVVDQPESTVIGAAMYAFAGTGFFDSADGAQLAMKPSYTTIYPSSDKALYQELYEEFCHA